MAGTVLAASSSTQYLKNSPIPGISTRPALVLKQEPGSQPGTDYVPRWTVTPIFFFCALHLSRFMGWRVTLKDLLSSRPVIFSTQMQQLGKNMTIDELKREITFHWNVKFSSEGYVPTYIAIIVFPNMMYITSTCKHICATPYAWRSARWLKYWDFPFDRSHLLTFLGHGRSHNAWRHYSQYGRIYGAVEETNKAVAWRLRTSAWGGERC